MHPGKQDPHIVPQPFAVSRAARETLHGHKSVLLWFTGLSGSGKSSIASAAELELHRRGISTYVLDGDNLRSGLNAGLGFSREDRQENIRRAAETAKLMVDCGLIVLATFISPYRRDRDAIRQTMRPGDFVEIYVNCPLEECERRDPKGLYRRARTGAIPSFTGISDPYEPPVSPELVLKTSGSTIASCAAEVVRYLAGHGYLGSRG